MIDRDICFNVGCWTDIADGWLNVDVNSRHQWMWDEPSLKSALENHDFRDIKRCKYQDRSDSRFELIENKKRHYQTICLKATK